MSIISLSPVNFRNLKDHEVIQFHPKLNLFIGKNASGKTSILEAIYYLSTGKSFRTRLIKNIVCSHNNESEFVLFGKLVRVSETEETKTIGIKRSIQDKSMIKIDGSLVSTASELAHISPTLVIQPSSFELLDGSPKIRRKFLDWGVFHVEHRFGTVWKEYIYCLKQRNTLLRNDRIDHLQLSVWDKKLAELGQSIDEIRKSFLAHYNKHLTRIIEAFGLPSELNVRYYKGWEKSKEFGEFLESYRTKDIEKRYTQYGPQRADIKITLDGKNAEQILSRGQQKLLITAMHLSHIELVNSLTEKASVTLIDDVTAELDHSNLELIFKRLSQCNTQVICTGIEYERIRNLVKEYSEYKMFHVEHGEVKKFS